MPLFRYRAIDPSGKPMEGTMEGESAQEITAILQERGAQVNEVTLDFTESPSLYKKSGRRALRWEDVALLNDQLLVIAKSNLPLSESLQALAKDINNKRLKPVLEQVQQDLDSGHSLEAALQRSPEFFPPVYIGLIRAGERSGNLVGVLKLLSSYSTRVLDIRDRVHAALVYPVFVLAATVIALFNIMFTVVPNFARIFDEFGAGLPAPTRFLVGVSDLFRNHYIAGIVAILILIVTIVVLRLWLSRSFRGRAFIDRIREGVPILGGTFRFISIARFTKALGLLLEAKVPMEESLELASMASGNDYLKSRVMTAATHVSYGDTLADSFSDTGYFPHSYLWFLANGESQGALATTMHDLSAAYDRQVTSRDEAMLNMLTPITVLVLGFMVAFVVFALYLPIFTLGDAISS